MIGRCIFGLLLFQAWLSVPAPLVPQQDIFRTAQSSYSLTASPPYPQAAQVFVNGLLDLQGVDYLISESTLVFTGTDTVHMESPTIQVFYMRAP
jgi:hypothetical protein